MSLNRELEWLLCRIQELRYLNPNLYTARRRDHSRHRFGLRQVRSHHQGLPAITRDASSG